MIQITVEKMRNAIGKGLHYKNSKKKLLKDTRIILKRKGWIDDPDLGWVIKQRMEDCFAKRILIEQDGHTVYTRQKDFTPNEVCRYLTIKEHLVLIPVAKEVGRQQAKIMKEKKLEKDLEDVWAK